MTPFRIDHLQMACDLARCLGQGWHAAAGAWIGSATVSHPDGRELQLYARRNAPDRVVVHGCYPPHPHGPLVDQHEITVRRDRGPATLAREVTRRLLPGYQRDLAVVTAALRQDRRDQAARGQRAEWIARLLPGSRPPADLPHGETSLTWYPASGSVQVRIFGAGSTCRLEMGTIPTDVAEQICAVLADRLARDDPQPGARCSGRVDSRGADGRAA